MKPLPVCTVHSWIIDGWDCKISLKLPNCNSWLKVYFEVLKKGKKYIYLGHNIFETSQPIRAGIRCRAWSQFRSIWSNQCERENSRWNEHQWSQLWRRWSDKCRCRLLHILSRVQSTLFCWAHSLIQWNNKLQSPTCQCLCVCQLCFERINSATFWCDLCQTLWRLSTIWIHLFSRHFRRCPFLSHYFDRNWISSDAFLCILSAVLFSLGV